LHGPAGPEARAQPGREVLDAGAAARNENAAPGHRARRANRRAGRIRRTGSATVVMAVAMPMAGVSMTVPMGVRPVMVMPFMDDDRRRRGIGAVDRVTIHRRPGVVVIDPHRRPVMMMVDMPVARDAGARGRPDRAAHDRSVAAAEGLAEQRAGTGA